MSQHEGFIVGKVSFHLQPELEHLSLREVKYLEIHHKSEHILEDLNVLAFVFLTEVRESESGEIIFSSSTV